MCAERVGLHSSLLIQLEAHEVLKRKFPKTPNACDLFGASFQAAQLIVDCAEPVDDNDRRLVAAVTAADMDMFVTGDKRVLGWALEEDTSGNLKLCRLDKPELCCLEGLRGLPCKQQVRINSVRC